MSNTIRLTSEYGDVRYAKSLTTYDDADILARRTDKAWIAHDIDWPERDDFPRWHLPRNRDKPTVEWIGSIVREADGTIRHGGPLSDEQLVAVIEAGGIIWTSLKIVPYDDNGAVLYPQYIDWTTA